MLILTLVASSSGPSVLGRDGERIAAGTLLRSAGQGGA